MSPPRLTEASLHSVRSGTILPTYDRGATRIGIVHIGPGAFHRAHQAYYVDTLLHSDKRWAISALSLKSTGMRDALAPQQGLYTLVELGAAPRARVIGAIREMLVGATDADAAFARLAARDTRIVSLTVTEKGYCLDASNQLDLVNADIAHDLANPDKPRSTIGWIVEGLRRRRAQGIPPYAVLSCDNLPDNGVVLKRALIAFARTSDADLARWIEAEVTCPRTMVDSITPATDDALRARAEKITGVHRRLAHSARAVYPVGGRRRAGHAGCGLEIRGRHAGKRRRRLRSRQAAAAERPAFDARLSRPAAWPRVGCRRDARRAAGAIRRTAHDRRSHSQPRSGTRASMSSTTSRRCSPGFATRVSGTC